MCLDRALADDERGRCFRSSRFRARAAALQRALRDCQVGVVPGTSHALPMEKPELVNRLILDFLAAEQVPKMLGTGEIARLS
jgi:pimeloyl-ACP methyl ester carboxylesterase